MRIFDAETLLFSTWENEEGLLNEGPNQEEGIPFIGEIQELPSVLKPLGNVLRAAPNATHLRIEGLDLGKASFTTTRLPSEFILSREGALASEWIPLNADGTLREGRFLFGGAIPLDIRLDDALGVRYQIAVEDPIVVGVPRVEGLSVLVEPFGQTHVRFQLQAPTGVFTSYGCEPVPGTFIPPGHYVIGGDVSSEWHVEIYENNFQYALQELRVDVHVTIIETESV